MNKGLVPEAGVRSFLWVGTIAAIGVSLTFFVDFEDGDSVASAVPASHFAGTPQVSRRSISYNRDVRPILADACFQCHGPDGAAREADLRLDRSEADESVDGAYAVIVPGSPDSSELISRIESTNPRHVMPPPESKLALTAAEKSILRQWISEGAVYEQHWSFEPLPRSIDLPEVEQLSWVRDAIDHFVLADLESRDLHPTREASRERWLRRVTFDLTGLPPTIEEIESFVADASTTAHERVVDRLLASPRYGERMAVPWLDLARYADTYGYSVDGMRAVWPWRDWLIGALNDNMPYDEMVTQMIAGDLLPDATRDQILATTFNRLHRMNAEGGSIREEWRNEYVADRLHTFGTAFLGLTLECARCHDHRYDPITQRNYYEMFAFFNSIDESGTTEFQRADIVPPPSLLLADAAQTDRVNALQEEVERAVQTLALRQAEAEPAFKAWIGSSPQVAIADLVGRYQLDAIGEDGILVNLVESGPPGHVVQHESAVLPVVEAFEGRSGIRLDGDNLIHIPGVSDLDRWTPFTIAVRFKVDEVDDGQARVIVHRTSGTDVGPFGFDLVLDGSQLVARAYRHWPGNGIGVRTHDVISPKEWAHVVWRYDGSSTAAGLTLWVNGEQVELQTERDGPMVKKIGGGHPYGPGGHDLVIGQRFRDRGLAGGVVSEVAVVRRAVSPLEALQLFSDDDQSKAVTSASVEDMRRYYFSAVSESVRAAMENLSARRKELIEHEESIAEISVMREMRTPREAHVLARGLYDAERHDGNRVDRRVPDSILGWPADQPRDRLGLSAWLMEPDHPLTARVAVNRLWALCFGRGLVASTDNFGLQGAWPTHPELLDALARSFIESGWDTKAMVRRIVLSATYRQDSATTRARWQDDPDNALLARGPSRRLDAEMIRDCALAASGLMVEKIGGRSVHPYQPSRLWEEVNGAAYTVGTGEDLYRRSMYTVWKRSVPAPNMMAFDAPTRESCTPQRSQTNTPLQALVILNDVQFVEAARVLAARVMTSENGEVEQIATGFRLLTGQQPSATDLDSLVKLWSVQRAIYASGEADASALLGQGAWTHDEELDEIDHAAMTIVMHTIMNLDATVWLR